MNRGGRSVVAGLLCLLGLVLVAKGPAGAALDMFLKVDGIQGESTDSKHKNEIGVLSWSWAVDVPGTIPPIGGAGRAQYSDLAVRKYVDKASPELFLSAATGKHIKSAILTVRTVGTNPLEFFKITLNDVLVTSVADGGDGSDWPIEDITLNYRNISFFYSPTGGGIEPPRLINPGTRTNAEGDTVSLQIVAVAPNVESVTFSASGLPPGLAINRDTGLITGTLPIDSAGAYGVSVFATDPGGLTAMTSFTWTVTLGQPRISGLVAAKGWASPGVLFVDVRLTNSGTGHAGNVVVKTVVPRTLVGTGVVTYDASLPPVLPFAVGDLNVGASTTVRFHFNVPATVTRFSITENGTVQNVRGTTFNYSIGQAVMP